jgi:UrcA family protein
MNDTFTREMTMKTTLLNLDHNHLAAACAVLVLGMAAPAHAGDLTGRDVTVQYGDLAIDTEQGAKVLLRRIESAAHRVCAPLNHGTLASRANEGRCRGKVIAATVNTVNHPMVQAAFDRARGIAPSVASLDR